MRFGIAVVPSSSWSRAAEAARVVEEAGFDVLMTGDHMRHPLDPTFEFLDGWTVLTAWAAQTTKVRLAMYASNLIYRQPAVLAGQAAVVDQISNGRLLLGIGAGIFSTDHAMAGVPMWSPAERVGRVEEALEIVKRLLSRDTRDYHGRYYRVEKIAPGPAPVQQPHPPIVLGAQGPRMLRIAARLADGWNTFGGYDVKDREEFYARTAERSRLLDRECEAIGRAPSEVMRSVLVHHSHFDPWKSASAFEEIVTRFHEMGMEELIFYFPRDDERPQFDEIVTGVLPKLQASLR